MAKVLDDITCVPGIFAANVQNEEAGTGCTVIVCPKGAVGGVDVRGGAPATRETDLLRPEETVQQLHAVVLSGGSAYGLAASCGVAEELERRGIGLDVGVGVVPIVSSACVFDLGCGIASVRPNSQMGARAVNRALDGEAPLEQGNFGGGCGCTVGKFMGPGRAMKAGLGSSAIQNGDLVVGAVACVNACGNVVDPASGAPIAGMLSENLDGIVSEEDLLMGFGNGPSQPSSPLTGQSESEDSPMGSSPKFPRTNTTISCIATNARLTKAQATKLAQMSADAYAHAIRPTHTPNDGDTIFVMATGEVELPSDAPAMDILGTMAVRSLEQAIVNGAMKATSAYGYKAACDL